MPLFIDSGWGKIPCIHCVKYNPPCQGFSGYPLYRVWCNTLGNFFGTYIKWVDLPLVLCMGFTHGFGHDGFLRMVFCRSSKGTMVMF